MCTDMEQQIPVGCGRAVAGTGEPRKGVQANRLVEPEHPLPEARADAGDAGETCLRSPEANGASEAAEVGEQLPHLILTPWLDRHDQEDRGLGDRAQDRLALAASPRAVGR